MKKKTEENEGHEFKFSFKESLKELGIEEYYERIYHSNSHGELFHMMDYMQLAEVLSEKDKKIFPLWFDEIVKGAEKEWKRPASVFQHIIKLMNREPA